MIERHIYTLKFCDSSISYKSKLILNLHHFTFMIFSIEKIRNFDLFKIPIHPMIER